MLKQAGTGERIRLLRLTRGGAGANSHDGEKDRCCAPLPPVSLAALVAPDHVSRHLERSLALSVVRDLVRDLVRETSAAIGLPSIDPVVVCTLPLLRFFAGLRSARQLRPVVADRRSRR